MALDLFLISTFAANIPSSLLIRWWLPTPIMIANSNQLLANITQRASKPKLFTLQFPDKSIGLPRLLPDEFVFFPNGAVGVRSQWFLFNGICDCIDNTL